MNVLFVDVDGPLIPASLYHLDHGCSALRSILSTTAIGFLQQLCEEYNAQIVTNTSHNYHEVRGNDLRADLIRFKLDPKYIHKNWRTKYPHVDTSFENFPARAGRHPRLVAIQEWEQENGPIYNWVCFDDEPFTQLRNLVLVDFHDGITLAKYNQAALVLSEVRQT